MLGRCFRACSNALLCRRSVRCAALCAAVILALVASWSAYRVLGFWRDEELLNKLATTEPGLGYEGVSWGVLDLGGIIKQNSLLGRPGVWRVVYPIFSRVSVVRFRGTADADLERCRGLVERFSNPLELYIFSDKITDSGLEAVARFKNLNGFTLLSNARVTDAGVARLHLLENLETLSLDSLALTDHCVVEMSRFPRLRKITLCNVPVSVRALDAIGRMKTLKRLDIWNAQVSEEASEKMALFKESHPELDIIY